MCIRDRIDTNTHSRKVKDAAASPRANLIYYDATGDGYVSFRGNMTLTSREYAVSQYWDGWAPFYPNGSATPNYGLFLFEPDAIEFVSTFRFKVGAGREDWLPPTLVKQGGEWVVQVPTVPPAPTTPGWVCTICKHVYDPVKDGGGLPFEQLPDTWKCPVCGQPKSVYVKQTTEQGTVQWVH
eukprot:TRINITY_DN21815_c0_g1_i2.p1 TRINITY_DN21815_c0_g1~~TRINITY_DN21815_c0_g1_i2.p1  ORF type:complete len:182 (+),score=44.38 TRINITY_DN21815_c0_g1_i2:89-634(+)